MIIPPLISDAAAIAIDEAKAKQARLTRHP
jgi:hypothetical protein